MLRAAGFAAAFFAIGAGPVLAQDAGSFTQAQVTAGHESYYGYCGQCHGDALAGAGEVPPLTGALFNTDWGKHSIHEFYLFISTAMPQGLEGDLSAETYANIVAYLLAANGAKPGSQPLDKNSSVKIGDIADGKLVMAVLGQDAPSPP